MKRTIALRAMALVLLALSLSACAAQPVTQPPSAPAQTSTMRATQKVNPNADPYFLAFNELLAQDPHGYDGIKYVAVDMTASLATDVDPFLSMLGAYCNSNGFVLLPDARAKLEDNGYIHNGVFTEGYIIAFDDVQYSDNYVVTDASIWHGESEIVSGTFTLEAQDGQWHIAT